jgi:hypothetical protein
VGRTFTHGLTTGITLDARGYGRYLHGALLRPA